MIIEYKPKKNPKNPFDMKKVNYWECSEVEALISRYIDNGGEVLTIEEGCLGYGFTILYPGNVGLKTIIIKECAINEWTSGHLVRKYNKCPAKYMKIIENY